MNPKTSRKIANLGLLAALAIVFSHLPTATEPGIYRFLRTRFPLALVYPAVSFFFAVSGYLLAGRCETPGWWGLAVSKRIRTLVIPYCALNALCALPRILMQATGLSNPSPGAPALECGWRLAMNVFGFVFPAPPENLPLWYVRCIFLFVLVSAPMLAAMRRSRKASLALCGAAYVAFALHGTAKAAGVSPSWMPMTFDYGFSLIGFLFFTVGATVRIHPLPRLHGRGAAIAAILAWTAGFLFIDGHPFAEAAWKPIGHALLIAGVWTLTPDWRWPRALTSLAFPIFGLHMLAINVLSVAVKRSTPALAMTFTAIGFFAWWAFAIGGAAAFAALLRRFAPKAAAILFGGR